MELNELLTDKLTEKVYYSRIQDGNEYMQEQIKAFLMELYKRRRDDPIEGGLQANMLIMPNAYAAKITENDGTDPHIITIINLLRYIKGKNTFYKREVSETLEMIKEEKNEKKRKGIDIRIIDSQDKLEFLQISNAESHTEFQLNVLRNLLDSLWSLKQREAYKSIEVGFYSHLSNVDLDELNDEQYKAIINAIKTEKRILDIDIEPTQ